MKFTTVLAEIENKRSVAIAEIDDTKIRPAIRNHLVQLFRKAVAVDPLIGKVVVGMGVATVSGRFQAHYVADGECALEDCGNYGYVGGISIDHAETEALMSAVKEYSDMLPELPYIGDITRDDLVPRSVKKAKIWGKR